PLAHARVRPRRGRAPIVAVAGGFRAGLLPHGWAQRGDRPAVPVARGPELPPLRRAGPEGEAAASPRADAEEPGVHGLGLAVLAGARVPRPRLRDDHRADHRAAPGRLIDLLVRREPPAARDLAALRAAGAERVL